jgi:hypothetical protein
VTVQAERMVTVQVVPENESQPLQPLKRERESGLAVRVTTVPYL